MIIMKETLVVVIIDSFEDRVAIQYHFQDISRSSNILQQNRVKDRDNMIMRV